jgi:hypothetical protein
LHEERRSLSADPASPAGEPLPETTARYDVHGVGIEIVDRTGACATAIDRRLAAFASPSRRDHGLCFEYVWGPASARHSARRPAASGRPVYDTDLGEVLYHADDDVLWATTHDGARVRCDCREGAVSIALGSRARTNADWLGSRPFLTLPLVELMKRRGLFCVHAAGLVANERAVVIAGSSGCGKTTLTIALVRAGFGLLSDDMLFVRQQEAGVELLSFPDELDVTPATARLFPELRELGDRPVEPGWSKHRIRAEEVFDIEPADRALPGLLLVPGRDPGRSSALRPLDPDQALVELAPNVLLTDPAAARRHIDALAELVRASKCYRLRVGDDLEAIPALLADALAEARRWPSR